MLILCGQAAIGYSPIAGDSQDQKIPVTVGLLLVNNLEDFTEAIQPANLAGENTPIQFDVGKAVSTIIRRQFADLFEYIDDIKSIPVSGSFDLIIKIYRQSSNSEIVQKNGKSRVVYNIALNFDFYDGKNFDLLKQSRINGSGLSSDIKNPKQTKRYYGEAIANAIRSIKDQIPGLFTPATAANEHPEKEQPIPPSRPKNGADDPALLDVDRLLFGKDVGYAAIAKVDGDLLMVYRTGKIFLKAGDICRIMRPADPEDPKSSLIPIGIAKVLQTDVQKITLRMQLMPKYKTVLPTDKIEYLEK